VPELPLVRAGRAEDADAAVAGWRQAQAARRSGEPLPVGQDERVRGYLAKSDSFFVVADDGGRLVGMALGMQALEDDGAGPPMPGLCHISMVFVHPDRWGEGLGKLLMRRLVAEAEQRGFRAFQLWTQADNGRALGLYEGMGFARSGREKDDDLGEHVVHLTWR
jgi:ribosomal protein S18 acetylase RimI-like enzyme